MSDTVGFPFYASREIRRFILSRAREGAALEETTRIRVTATPAPEGWANQTAASLRLDECDDDRDAWAERVTSMACDALESGRWKVSTTAFTIIVKAWAGKKEKYHRQAAFGMFEADKPSTKRRGGPMANKSDSPIFDLDTLRLMASEGSGGIESMMAMQVIHQTNTLLSTTVKDLAGAVVDQTDSMRRFAENRALETEQARNWLVELTKEAAENGILADAGARDYEGEAFLKLAEAFAPVGAELAKAKAMQSMRERAAAKARAEAERAGASEEEAKAAAADAAAAADPEGSGEDPTDPLSLALLWVSTGKATPDLIAQQMHGTIEPKYHAAMDGIAAAWLLLREGEK